MEAKDFAYEIVPSARLQALSAAVPFAGAAHQKQLAVLVKLLEIQEICRHYDTSVPQKTQLDAASRQKMIQAIIPHVSEKKQGSLKAMAQFMEMQELFTNFENIKELSEWM